MRWFRSRGGDRPKVAAVRPAGRRPTPTAVRRRDDADWRSYDLVAEAYARVRAPETGTVASDLVRMLGLDPGNRVLDVGTGTGVAARAAADALGPTGLSVGIDPSMPMLSIARREVSAARFAAARAIDLPFADHAFDAVVAAFTLAGFQKYDTALFDMLRVLKAGGRLGVCTWGRSEDEFTRTWREVAESFAGVEILRDAAARAMPWAERFEDPARLKDTLYDAGLRNIRVERREYRFEVRQEDYLAGGEITSMGRFLHQMLGDELWETFRRRVRDAFAQRFPDTFNDFREAVLAVGTKP
ncbi:MAG: methyltransferase domain-containing protein [Actinomycetota bacterium]